MKVAIIGLMLAFLCVPSHAQEVPKKPSAEDMKQIMETSMTAMGPVMGKMAEASIEAQLSIAEKPETARRVAQYKKNLYDALLQQGFSKSQAFQLVLNTPLPGGGPASR
jgi:hypothetical protein